MSTHCTRNSFEPEIGKIPDNYFFSRLGWEKGSYENFQIKVYREYGNYEEEYLNVAYLDFNEAKVRGLEPDTFYKFELAGLIVLPDGDFTIGPYVKITARTVGQG